MSAVGAHQRLTGAPPRASSGKLRRAKSREGGGRGRNERTVSCAIAAVIARRKERKTGRGGKASRQLTD